MGLNILGCESYLVAVSGSAATTFWRWASWS